MSNQVDCRFYHSGKNKMVHHDPLKRVDILFHKWEQTSRASKFMLATGRKDVHQTMIYDQDILDYATFTPEGHDTLHRGIVDYDVGECQWILRNINGDRYHNADSHPLGWVLQNDSEAEIIGNTYQNPHLMEESK